MSVSGRDDICRSDTAEHLPPCLGKPMSEVQCVSAWDIWHPSATLSPSLVIEHNHGWCRDAKFTVPGFNSLCRKLGLPDSVPLEDYSRRTAIDFANAMMKLKYCQDEFSLRFFVNADNEILGATYRLRPPKLPQTILIDVFDCFKPLVDAEKIYPRNEPLTFGRYAFSVRNQPVLRYLSNRVVSSFPLRHSPLPREEGEHGYIGFQIHVAWIEDEAVNVSWFAAQKVDGAGLCQPTRCTGKRLPLVGSREQVKTQIQSTVREFMRNITTERMRETARTWIANCMIYQRAEVQSLVREIRSLTLEIEQLEKDGIDPIDFYLAHISRVRSRHVHVDLVDTLLAVRGISNIFEQNSPLITLIDSPIYSTISMCQIVESLIQHAKSKTSLYKFEIENCAGKIWERTCRKQLN